MGNRELNLLQSRNTALILIGRMPGAHIRQVIHPVKFFGRQHPHRRILHQHFITVALDDGFTGYFILIIHLDTGCLAIVFLITGDDLKIGALCGSPRGILRVTEVTGSPDIPHLMDILTGCQTVDNLDRLQLAHAKAEQVCLRIHQNTRMHRIIPIIIMGKPPQRRLQTTDDNRHIRAVNPPDCF